MENLANVDEVEVYQPGTGGIKKSTARAKEEAMHMEGEVDGGLDEEVLTDMSSEDDYTTDHNGHRIRKHFPNDHARKIHK